MKLSRRSFLKNTTAASAGAALAGGLVQSVIGKEAVTITPGPGNKWPGRVVIDFNKTAATLSTAGVGAVTTAVVKTMVDESIQRLTDQTTVAAAWKAVFPASLTATSKIAIKVPLDFANQTMAPHWSLVKAITDGLQQMTINGTTFPPANITIYDMRGTDQLTNYGYTAANFPGVKIVHEPDASGTGSSDGARNQQYANSLKTANFLISVFRLGGHETIYEGFTLGFKNHYGTYAVDHGTATAPGYLRDINCTGVVYNKHVLTVCAGLFGAKEASGDPGSATINYYNYAKGVDPSITATTAPSTTIVMSTDPVSTEMQAIKIIRQNQVNPNGTIVAGGNGKWTTADMPKYLRASGGVAGALTDATYNIGIIDESAMDIRRIINGALVTSIRENGLSQTDLHPGAGITAAQTGLHSIFIEFALPVHFVNENASIEIFDMKGAIVYKTTRTVLGVVNHYAWDQHDTANNHVRPGLYVVRVAAGTVTMATKFSVAK
jgi:hypothetical protein